MLDLIWHNLSDIIPLKFLRINKWAVWQIEENLLNTTTHYLTLKLITKIFADDYSCFGIRLISQLPLCEINDPSESHSAIFLASRWYQSVVVLRNFFFLQKCPVFNPRAPALKASQFLTASRNQWSNNFSPCVCLCRGRCHTHDELIEKQGRYYQLYTYQARI